MPLAIPVTMKSFPGVRPRSNAASKSRGMTFNGLFPKFSYFRIPRYEMGLQLMQYADGIIRSGRKTGIIPELKVEFIEAKKNSFAKGKVPA